MKNNKDLRMINVADYINYDNLQFPFVETITSRDFPAQTDVMLGATIPLWYMDETVHEKQYGEFKVIRWDLTVPYRVILINDDLQIIIVTRSEDVLDDGTGQVDDIGRHVNNAHVHQIPIQNFELLGMETMDYFFKDTKTNCGVFLRADAGGDHPQFVLLETLDDETYRVITLEETKSVCCLHDIVAKSTPLHKKHEWWPKDWRNLKI